MQSRHSSRSAEKNTQPKTRRRLFQTENDTAHLQRRKEFGAKPGFLDQTPKIGIGKNLKNALSLNNHTGISKGEALKSRTEGLAILLDSSKATLDTQEPQPRPISPQTTDTPKPQTPTRHNPLKISDLSPRAAPLQPQPSPQHSPCTPRHPSSLSPRSPARTAAYWLHTQPGMSPHNRHTLAAYAVALSHRGFLCQPAFPLAESFELLDLFLLHTTQTVPPDQLQILYLACVFLAVQEMQDDFPYFAEVLAAVVRVVEEVFTAVQFQHTVGHLKTMLNRLFPGQSIRELAGRNPISVFAEVAPLAFSRLELDEYRILFQIGMMNLELLLFDVNALRFGPDLIAVSMIMILKKSLAEEKHSFNLERELDSLDLGISAKEISKCANYILNKLSEEPMPEVLLTKYECPSKYFASKYKLFREDQSQDSGSQLRNKNRAKSLPAAIKY